MKKYKTGAIDDSEYFLEINDLKKTDEGEYFCKIGDTSSNKMNLKLIGKLLAVLQYFYHIWEKCFDFLHVLS